MADELNFQIPQQGFDSYLYGIIPDDQAVLAGAFSVSMQQVRNIDRVDAKEFAKIAYSMESTTGLPLVGGTDIPTDTPLSTAAKIKTALGSGVYGTFTTSNFFGAMSGLPYPWQNIYDKIIELQTNKLKNIYQELYLAVQWEVATASVPITKGSDPDGLGTYDWYWEITAITLTDRGGGYGRGGASAPIITITGGSGATASCTIGTDPNSVGSDGSGLFGRVDSFTVGSLGSKVYYATGQLSPTPGEVPSPPQAQIQCPPTATLAVQSNGNKATGGTNTPYDTVGWPLPMNDVVGSMALGSEKGYIKQANDEIQAITTSSAQNFNASNVLNTLWNITGIALKHEQRARYIAMAPVPVPWDNRVASYPTSLYVMVDGIPEFAKQTEPHMAAQTLEHISDLLSTGGQSIVAMMRQERNQDRLAEVGIELDNNLKDRLDVDLTRKLMENGVLPGAVEGIESPNGNIYTLPAWPENTDPIAFVDGEDEYDIIDTTVGSIEPLLNGDPNPIVNPIVPAGGVLPDDTPRGVLPEPPINLFVNSNPLPPELNAKSTGTTLKPSTYNVDDAIDKVIECNCDCWVN